MATAEVESVAAPLVPVIPGGPANLEQALPKVTQLIKIQLGPDHSPDIDAAPIPLYYEANKDSGFEDKQAFALGEARFMEDAARQAKLDELLEEGNQLSAMLYTWRCCSHGIPAVKAHDQSNRMEIYQCTVDVLGPEIHKLKKFYELHERAAGQFCIEIERLCKDPSVFASESYLLSLGKMINMFAVLNELKNIKASVKNDFAQYKRAAEMCKMLSDSADITAAQKLSLFLATNDSVISDIKKRLQQINKHEDILADIVNTCLNMYENNMYLLPTEKQGMIKVIGFCLFLMDKDKDININTNKKLKLSKIDKLFKKVEAIPLFGDMMIGPFKFIENTPNYDPTKWPHCNSEKDSTQSQLLKVMPHLREEYMSLMSDLTTHGTNLKFYNSVYKKSQIQAGDNQMYYELALRSLHTLSSWTSKITEMFSWKLLHPTSHDDDKNCPENAEEYEKATLYNYTSEEKFAMTEVISMIKSVQEVVLNMELQFTECINRHIYQGLQEFVQITLREPLRKSIKKKKQQLKVHLTNIRDICSDIRNWVSPENDPLTSKLKKDSETGFRVTIGMRPVPPGSTQLYMLRTMLESLIDKSVEKKKSLRKDLEPPSITVIETFLKNTFFWNYMINFARSVRQCCDLSQFWYREFYLEMTMGKRIQFPIDMSMPWILANHILETMDHSMMEYVLYPLDLYNDSAYSALNVFKKQHLYEEVEAEVDLCFDQLVFKLSDQIFQHYKLMAGILYLDKTFKGKIKKLGLESTIPKVPKTKYTTFLKQQHVSILGRQVDLKKLLAQRMNAAFVKALEVAIGRFESKDITGIMELDGLIEVNRLAHRLLSEYVEMDTFEALFQEANTSVTAPYGKISLKIFYEVTMDFVPRYCYNGATNRYVPNKLDLVDEKIQRDKAPSAAQYYFWGHKNLTECYSAIYGRYSSFVGEPHFDAMIKLITYQEMALIFNELLNIIKQTINNVLVPYFRTLQEAFPKRLQLPRYEMTSLGALTLFQDQLQPITSYGDLGTKVFHYLRIVGNTILFFIHLEQALSRKEITELKEANLFLNIIPKPHVPVKEGSGKEDKDATLKSMMTKLQKQYSSCHAYPVIEKHGTDEQKHVTAESILLTREKLCCGLTIFEMILPKIKAFIDSSDDVWTGPPPPNGVIEVTHSKEFHRVWSAIQFFYCIPPGKNQFTVEELFGEGLQWAGCTLMVLLGQHRRFQAFDLGYHLIKVHKVDNKDDSIKGVNIRKMVDRLRKFQILNDQIFASLEKYTNKAVTKDRQPYMFTAPVRHFDPPHKDKPTDEQSPSPPSAPPPPPPMEDVTSHVRDSINLVDEDFNEDEKDMEAEV